MHLYVSFAHFFYLTNEKKRLTLWHDPLHHHITAYAGMPVLVSPIIDRLARATLHGEVSTVHFQRSGYGVVCRTLCLLQQHGGDTAIHRDAVQHGESGCVSAVLPLPAGGD